MKKELKANLNIRASEAFFPLRINSHNNHFHFWPEYTSFLQGILYLNQYAQFFKVEKRACLNLSD